MGIFCMTQGTQTGLCINLEEWDVGGDGREVQVAGNICIPTADSCWCLTENSVSFCKKFCTAIMLLLSRFSRFRLCVTPYTAAHQAPPSLGFSRQEHWSGLPFPSPMHESEKWKQSHSVVSDSQRPHGLQPTRLLHPWDFPGKSNHTSIKKITNIQF